MAQENVQAINQPSKMQLNEGIVEGKITAIEQPEKSDYTYYTMSLKAADEYSLPAVIQVSQPAKERPFGRVNDLLRLKVRLGGYPRKSGSITYVSNTLSVVEVL